jgi:2-dehydropantoate 2-reductase
MFKKIAVLGAGAIGSSIGADLTEAGHDVVLIDQWPAHIEAMKKDGLRVTMPGLEIHAPVRACHLCDVGSLNTRFDLVLLAAKSYDSLWLTEFIRPYLAPEGTLVSVQNSLNDEWIAPAIGVTRDVGCVVELSAEVFTPGVVKRNTDRKRTWLAFGELHGRITPRVRELESMFKCAATTAATSNIWGAKWTKLVTNSMTQGPIGMLGLTSSEAGGLDELFQLSMRAGRETIAVGNALGYTMEAIFGMSAEEFMGSTDETLENILRTIISHVGASRNAVVQDHAKGRRSEVAYINGLVADKGRQAGIPVPYNTAITEVNRLIETGSLKPALSNIARVHDMVKQAAAC